MLGCPFAAERRETDEQLSLCPVQLPVRVISTDLTGSKCSIICGI